MELLNHFSSGLMITATYPENNNDITHLSKQFLNTIFKNQLTK